jgi:hypothetical protein
MTAVHGAEPKVGRTRTRTRVVWLVALALAAYIFWPRTANLRDFDAGRVAQLERS